MKEIIRDSEVKAIVSSSNIEAGIKTTSKKRKTPARSAANARERSRMRVLSKAFNKLKNCLPWVPPDTKLSKLDTLRLALSYITHLQSILEADEAEVDDSKTFFHQYVMGWPFVQDNKASKNHQLNDDDITCTTGFSTTSNGESTDCQ